MIGPLPLEAGEHLLDVRAERDWLKLDHVCTVDVTAVGTSAPPAGAAVTVIPNPVRHELAIELSGVVAVGRPLRTEVFGPDGRRLVVVEGDDARRSVQLPDGRAAGVYLARVTDLSAGWSVSRAFVVH